MRQNIPEINPQNPREKPSIIRKVIANPPTEFKRQPFSQFRVSCITSTFCVIFDIKFFMCASFENISNVVNKRGIRIRNIIYFKRCSGLLASLETFRPFPTSRKEIVSMSIMLRQ